MAQIKATHYKDKHYYSVMLYDNYYSNQEYLINGKVYAGGGYRNEIIVEGDTLEIRIITRNRYLAYYKHREQDIKMSVAEYDKLQKSYKNSEGEYNSLEDEYASRKLSQDFVPINGIEDVISEPIDVQVQEGFECPECKYIKPLFTLSRDKDFYVFEYDAWADFSEWVQEYMQELGIKKLDKYNPHLKEEFYVLEKLQSYTKMRMFGSEFFITDKYFGSSGEYAIKRGTYEGLLKEREDLITAIKKQIDNHIDAHRTKNVKRSTIAKLDELYQEIKYKKPYMPISDKIGKILDEINIR